MKSTYYAQIPTKILLSKKLTSFQKLLYADIQSLTNQKGYCYASNQYLSERHGKDIRHISKQISNLLKHNFLFVFNRPTGRNSNQNRKLFTQSTFIDYANEHDIDITTILQREKNSVKNHTANSVKNHKHNNISNKLNKKKRFINKSNDSGESTNIKSNVDQNEIDFGKLKKIKRNTKRSSFTTKLKNRKLKQTAHKKQTKVYTPKYKHTIKDLRNYNELLAHGITDHRSENPKNRSIDKLHALFSSQCKNPYSVIYTPEIYNDFKWDMDDIIEIFKYQLEHAAKYNKKIIKAIGQFILSEGFNGFKSWSPLIWWHQKMTKTAANELTEKGKKFLSSLKRAKVNGVMDLDSTIINKVADEADCVISKHVFMDGKTITMSYPYGIIDTMSKYIKEKTNRDGFKLVYITKSDFVNEFVEVVTKRNIIKPKVNGRSVFV